MFVQKHACSSAKSHDSNYLGQHEEQWIPDDIQSVPDRKFGHSKIQDLSISILF
jgi:hypothetical protein